jgi:hypothetical protein
MKGTMNRISYFGPNIVGGLNEPRLQTPVFFVGIQRDVTPPLVLGRSRLQRMRVILVEPDGALDAGEGGDNSALELLPRLPAPPHHLALQPRLVEGEILRGENDELYERIGKRIRRLRRLACGPSGEILDVADSRLLAPPQTGRAPAPSRAEEDAKSRLQPAPKPDAVFRKLLPGSGQWRVVPFGAFKQMLALQLTHPERLRDTHRLPCQAQVFELTAPQQVDQVAAAIFGDAAPGQLLPLTASAVLQLQLAPVLPPPSRVPRSGPRTAGMLLPGDRVFHLHLANDPTAEEAEPQCPPEKTQPSSAVALKTTIPERFAKPWEFQATREEALYDLICASTFWGALGGKLRRLIHWFAFRREFHKWQVLLNGRSADEQLWSVRPPRGGLTHRFVLAWAKKSIEVGGYDPRSMLTEWQIFWRRKGV